MRPGAVIGMELIPLLAHQTLPTHITEINEKERTNEMSMISKTKEGIALRIAHLQQKPVENAKLIKKWERLLRKYFN